MTDQIKVSRALISVSDKTGIVEFADRLQALGVEMISTGGTAQLLADHGLQVTDISTYTGYPEMMDGRLKTLHPKVHGGLLGRRGIDDQTMVEHGIPPIDLVVVNLYPFENTVAQPECGLANAIEKIDIGGPTMLRAAAKNHAAVGVLVDTSDYAPVAAELTNSGGLLSAATRFRLAVRAFEHSARYEGAIANYLGSLSDQQTRTLFPATLNLQLRKSQNMRYGENPHQQAAFYIEEPTAPASVASARLHQGKALSYNNVADTDAALECVKQFSQPACVIVKHANPCGVAIAETMVTAYQRAFQTDPTSAFGGIIACNREMDSATASTIIDQQFVEVVIAPTVSEEALATFATKPNVRVLSCGPLPGARAAGLDLKRVHGGLLAQEQDTDRRHPDDLQVVSQLQPDAEQVEDLLFAWRVAMFVKSNAIVYARDGQTIGVGAGQMSRVYSARIAAIKAADERLSVTGAVMASDAFFPFRDGIDTAATAGIRAVIQPGGSVRDEEVIAAANEHGLAMVFTGTRHFRH